MKLNGKVALVTGSAKRLGREIALGLARCGSHIVVHYRSSESEAGDTCSELAELGVEAISAQADLRHPEEIEALFNKVQGHFGRLDVLVNSAAGFERAGFDEIDTAAWDDVMRLNLRAPFLCIRQAARLMRSGDGGVVVNIADLSALQPWPGYTHHGVSKAGLIQLTRAAARELAPEIRVNCVVPGAILPPPGMALDDPSWQGRGERIPLGRTGRAEEVADTVVFLTSNDFVTGLVVPVDGGDHLLGTMPTE